MACKGMLPDGTRCTCPDEFTVDGLCASCAAPDTTALVPIGSTDLIADPKMAALYQELPIKAQAFLDALTKTGTIAKAAKACGISRQSHYYWKENLAGYEELYEVAERDVLDQLRDTFADRVENGLTELEYDGEGKLKRTRIRQDAGLLKAQMIARDPDFSADKGRNTNVVIVLNHTNEGGWAETEEGFDRPVEVQSAEIIHDAECEVVETEAPASNRDEPKPGAVADKPQEAPVEKPRSGETWRQQQHRLSSSEW